MSGAAAGGQSVTITNYLLERADGGGAWGTPATYTATEATSTGLVPGTVYTYRIAAANKYGSGPTSPELSALAAQAPDAPAAPTTVTEAPYVSITWVAPHD